MVKNKSKKDKSVPQNKNTKDKKRKRIKDNKLHFKQDPLSVPLKISIELYSTSAQDLLNRIPSNNDSNLELATVINKLQRMQLGKSYIRRNSTLDKTLKDNFESQPTKSLPIFEKREEILDLIDKNQVVVIYSEQNCGKTENIPQFILDNMIENENGSLCKIVCTQPYKNKVIKTFEKVSERRMSETEISYQVRFENFNNTKNFSLFFCTAGIFLKRLCNNFNLNQVSHLIIDEIQERDIPTDLLLGLMKEIIKEKKDLKLILMCSTGYCKKIARYFNGCPKIGVTPDIFPIDEYYLEDIIMLTNFNNLASFEKFEKKENMHKKYPKSVTNFVKTYELHKNTNIYLIVSLISYLFLKTKNGNMLILVPNTSDVRFLQNKINENNTLKSKTQVITYLQDEDISEFNTNRKIYLSVNEKFVPVNENNILYVINTGRIRIYTKNCNSNVENVNVDWISKKTLRERQKIAGRYQKGICFNLFSEASQENFEKYPEPLILRQDLDQVILQIKQFGIENTEAFLQSCLSCPDIYAIRKTIDVFKLNNILTEEEQLTRLGTMVSQLPLNQSLGRMVLIGTVFCCLKPVLIMAAYFNVRNIFCGNDEDVRKNKTRIGGSSDVLILLDLIRDFEKSGLSKKVFFSTYNIQENTMTNIEKVMEQITTRLYNMKLLDTKNYKEEKYNINSNNTNLIKSLLCIALHPNIAIIRKHNYKPLKDAPIETIFNNKVYIDKSSINYEKISNSPLLIYRNLCQLKRLIIQETTTVSPIHVVIFANDITFTEIGAESFITIADTLEINCSLRCVSLIKSVRQSFQRGLEYRLNSPKFVDWKENENNGDILAMKAVLQLLSTTY